MPKLGVHSEVGKLNTVMVCRPGLAHQRLTPGNAEELLFDDMLWVPEAQRDHHDFVLKMRERGTEVIEAKLPAVLTITKGEHEPRLASLKGIMAAKKKPLVEKPAAAHPSSSSSLRLPRCGSTRTLLRFLPLALGGAGCAAPVRYGPKGKVRAKSLCPHAKATASAGRGTKSSSR